MLTMLPGMYETDRGRGDRSEFSIGCYLLPSSERSVFFICKYCLDLLMHRKHGVNWNHLRVKVSSLFHVILYV